jgi:prohibitin 1
MKKLITVLLAVGFISNLTGCGRIETGNIGVRTDFNKTIVTDELQPGWYGSLFTSVDTYSIKEIEVAQNDMRPKAKDNLSLSDLDISIFYKVNPVSISEMLIKYAGMTYISPDGVGLPVYGLVDRQSRSVVYQIIGTKYESLSIHQRRTELETDVAVQLQAELDKADPSVFTITKVIVRQVVTDPALEQSIQAAVRVQKEVEAKTMQIQLARAEAERLQVEAEGQAAANRAVTSSLTPMLVELRRIEMQEKLAKAGTHTLFIDTKSPIMFTSPK